MLFWRILIFMIFWLESTSLQQFKTRVELKSWNDKRMARLNEKSAEVKISNRNVKYICVNFVTLDYSSCYEAPVFTTFFKFI